MNICPHCGKPLTPEQFPPRLIVDGVTLDVEYQTVLPFSKQTCNLFYRIRDEDVERVPLLIVTEVK